MLAPMLAAGAVTAALIATLSTQALEPAKDIERLSWLSGCWAQTRSDGSTEEHWMKPSGGTMLGMSRTVRGDRTAEFEFLRIAEVNGKLAYIAKPSDQPEATFPLKTLGEQEVVFENPTHDFPQRIIYRRSGEGSIRARIEGTMSGQVKGVDFQFQRCK